MNIPLYQVDAFTDQPFRGNPAAVCILDKELPALQMQQIAKEMNLSETAFVLKSNGIYHLRWFTPKVEVKLCGHATLASAHILWEQGYLAIEEIACFHTISGMLSAKKVGEWIELNFPVRCMEETAIPEALMKALNVEPLHVAHDGSDYLIEVENAEIVQNLAPDLELIKRAPVRGVIVTSRSDDPGVDFVSRFFAPIVGIDEDPVTGSAHCALVPYWSRKLGKNTFTARQLSERGGILKLRLSGERVFISGQAVTVMKGILCI